MKITQFDLFDKSQTAKEMYRIIEKYYNDLRTFFIVKNGRKVPLTSLTIEQFFHFVRKIPYKRDNKPIELIARPRYLLKGAMNGLDCKKKSILVASYLRANGHRYRLIGSSNRKSKVIHHVFPQIHKSGNWLNLDATYSNYKPYQQKFVSNYEVL